MGKWVKARSTRTWIAMATWTLFLARITVRRVCFAAARIEIEWPSGTREHYTNIRANQFLRLEEGRGLQP